MIRTHALVKTYGNRRNKKEAVRGIDLEVRRGEIFGLLGPVGAGKTTTIQMLCGILQPTSGEITVAGVDVTNNPAALGGRIGYMSEGFTLYGSLGVRENLDFFADLYRVPLNEREERIRDLLRFSRLEKAAGRRAEHLSGGMKKKLALACALVYSPQVLFLDEPTTGVDPVSRRDFWMLLNDFLGQGITIFVSTPYMDEAERFHRVALMHQGEIVACDTPAALKAALKGEMLDLLAEPQREAVARLRQHPKVSHVQVFGERVHLLVEDPQRDLLRLESGLGAYSVQLSDVRRSSPGLEDVFVAMMEKRSANGGSLSKDQGLFGYEDTSSVRSDRPPAAGEPSYAISVSNLTKTFDGFTAVEGISFDVHEGEIFGFLGPNGSGKTTAIRMLCGLLPPTSGSGTVAGWDILREQGRIKPEVGYMSQKFSLYGTALRIAEEAEFTPSNVQTKEDRTRLVYAVVIGLENSDLALKPGMIADVGFGYSAND